MEINNPQGCDIAWFEHQCYSKLTKQQLWKYVNLLKAALADNEKKVNKKKKKIEDLKIIQEQNMMKLSAQEEENKRLLHTLSSGWMNQFPVQSCARCTGSNIAFEDRLNALVLVVNDLAKSREQNKSNKQPGYINENITKMADNNVTLPIKSRNESEAFDQMDENKEKHHSTPVECPFCFQETFLSIEALKDRLLLYNNDLKCPVCNKMFENVSSLRHHVANCPVETGYVAPYDVIDLTADTDLNNDSKSLKRALPPEMEINQIDSCAKPKRKLLPPSIETFKLYKGDSKRLVKVIAPPQEVEDDEGDPRQLVKASPEKLEADDIDDSKMSVIYFCPACSMTLKTPEEARDHNNYHRSKNESLLCRICEQFLAKDVMDMTEHLRSAHDCDDDNIKPSVDIKPLSFKEDNFTTDNSPDVIVCDDIDSDSPSILTTYSDDDK